MPTKLTERERQLKGKRWLRALEIAKCLFEGEGYHIIYLSEIENLIKRRLEMGLRKIGALWKKEGKKGSFLSGTLDLGVLGSVNIAVFQTEKEKDDKNPDATIHIFEED